MALDLSVGVGSMKRSEAIKKLEEFAFKNYRTGDREYHIKHQEWGIILDFIEKEIGMLPPEYYDGIDMVNEWEVK